MGSEGTCQDCGATEAESPLNLDGYIHHGCTLRCIDRKKCERRKRKQKQRPKDGR